MMTNIGKCANCIHFPLCMAQKGGMNLQLASVNDCLYYQPQLPEGSVVLSRDELEQMVRAKMTAINNMAIITRKETAKELLEDFDNHGVYSQDYTNFMRKQFGVEVEE